MTKFEKDLMLAVFEEHSPTLGNRVEILDKLLVSNVVCTQVGAYIKFASQDPAFFDKEYSAQLGYNSGVVNIPGLSFGLGFFVLIKRGIVVHIEIYTYCHEIWDGNTDVLNYEIKKKTKSVGGSCVKGVSDS